MSERVMFGVGVVTLVLACSGIASAQTPRCLEQAAEPSAAVVVRPTTAYARPGGRALARFGVLNVNRVPTVLGLHGRCGAWLHVALPLRPNGITGWVRAAD